MKTDVGRPSIWVWIYVSRLYAVVSRCTENELQEHRLTLARLDVMAHLMTHEDCCTQEDLCDCLRVTKGHVSSLLDRMAKEGLVRREAHPSSRRCNRVELTPQGREIFMTIVPQRDSCLERMFSRLSLEEQTSLAELLKKLLDSVQSCTGGDA